MKKSNALYYFCESLQKFISKEEYDNLLDIEKQNYKPATFRDVRLHGSDALKQEIEPLRQKSFTNSLIFGSLASY